MTTCICTLTATQRQPQHKLPHRCQPHCAQSCPHVCMYVCLGRITAYKRSPQMPARKYRSPKRVTHCATDAHSTGRANKPTVTSLRKARHTTTHASTDVSPCSQLSSMTTRPTTQAGAYQACMYGQSKRPKPPKQHPLRKSDSTLFVVTRVCKIEHRSQATPPHSRRPLALKGSAHRGPTDTCNWNITP